MLSKLSRSHGACPVECHDLENDLLKIHHENNLKYMPQIDFGGMNECFKELLPIV